MSPDNIAHRQSTTRRFLLIIRELDEALITKIIKTDPQMATEALDYLEQFGTIPRPIHRSIANMVVRALCQDLRPSTAKRLLVLIQADKVSAEAITGKMFEQLNWTISPPR